MPPSAGNSATTNKINIIKILRFPVSLSPHPTQMKLLIPYMFPKEQCLSESSKQILQLCHHAAELRNYLSWYRMFSHSRSTKKMAHEFADNLQEQKGTVT
jgi:hypothetical protein